MNVTLDLWNDTGYTESGVERPPIGSALPDPDHTFTGLRPDKGDIFSSYSIKAAYTDLMDSSYVRISFDTANGDDLTIYGWVDSVLLKSDTEDYPMTVVNWHVDPWRTWGGRAVFRAGTVRRRPATGELPPQPYPYRYMMAGPVSTLVPQLKDSGNNTLWWCYLTYTSEYDDAQTTGLDVICFPCSFSDHIYITDGTDTGDSPSLVYALCGFYDECLGLTPSRIAGAYLSPIAPKDYTGTGSYESPINMHSDNAWTVMTHDHNGHMFAAFVGGASHSRYTSYQERTATLSSSMRTTDTESLVITGFDGEVISTLPWGLQVKDYTYRQVVESVGAYVVVRFDGLDSRSEGLCATIPCIPVNTTENSWSEYNYTGQREYDIKTRDTEQDREAVRGLTSSLSSMLSTMGLGMMFGGSLASAGGSVKGNNLIKGGAATGIGGIAETAVNWMSDRVYFNEEFQKWDDYASARQTDNLLLPGAGWDSVLFGRPISLVEMEADGYSVSQRDADIQMYGAHVSEPMTSCQALINAGGPLQITNLTVGGEIPVEAKEYMRMMFSNGVRLV